MTARHTVYVRVYFLLVLFLGLFLYKDYGVSWDESVDRINGLVNAKYVASLIAPEWASKRVIFSNVPDFATHLDKDHGVLFILPLVFIEVLWPAIDSRTYYLICHLCTYLIFVLGLWSTYNIGRIRFNSWRIGLLASTLLLLSPRFFAESFYNGKDIVFLSFFTFGIYTLLRLLRRPTLLAAVLHGVATAMATDIRILGCVLFALSLGMLVLEACFGSTEKSKRWMLGKVALLYCVVTVLFTIVGWPFLWEDPIGNFVQTFENMRRFRWEGYLLYFGEVMQALHIPWHYAPVWIIITTPIAYSLAFLTGCVSYMYALFQHGFATLRTSEGRIDLLFIGWFFIPMLMVIFLHSVIYDGWRHLYFTYPAFLLLGLRAAYTIWQASHHYLIVKRIAVAALLLTGTEVLYTVYRMIASHPNQQVFFSFLSNSEAEQLFERDYWGLSYRQGLEWIMAHDTAPEISVSAPFSIVLENNLSILKPDDRSRFKINTTSKERYFLTVYRTHPEAYPDSVGNEVYSIKTNGVKILSVFYRW